MDRFLWLWQLCWEGYGDYAWAGYGDDGTAVATATAVATGRRSGIGLGRQRYRIQEFPAPGGLGPGYGPVQRPVHFL